MAIAIRICRLCWRRFNYNVCATQALRLPLRYIWVYVYVYAVPLCHLFVAVSFSPAPLLLCYFSLPCSNSICEHKWSRSYWLLDWLLPPASAPVLVLVLFLIPLLGICMYVCVAYVYLTGDSSSCRFCLTTNMTRAERNLTRGKPQSHFHISHPFAILIHIEIVVMLIVSTVVCYFYALCKLNFPLAYTASCLQRKSMWKTKLLPSVLPG